MGNNGFKFCSQLAIALGKLRDPFFKILVARSVRKIHYGRSIFRINLIKSPIIKSKFTAMPS